MTNIKNKKTNKISFRTINTVLAITGVALYVASLFLANHDAMQRYELSQYRGEEQELLLENQRLSVKVAELQSMEYLAAASVGLNLVQAPAPVYVTAPGAVALR